MKIAFTNWASWHPMPLSPIDLSGPPPPSPCAARNLTTISAAGAGHFTVPLALEGSPFRLRVWEELQHIPYGKTISYRQLARRLGDVKCIRAAGSANGRNPVAIIVPCHRVIGSNGSLVGYAGGMERKKWLLEHENRHANGVRELGL